MPDKDNQRGMATFLSSGFLGLGKAFTMAQQRSPFSLTYFIIVLVNCTWLLGAYHLPCGQTVASLSEVHSSEDTALEARGFFDLNPFRKSHSSCTVYHDVKTGLYHTTLYLHWRDYGAGKCSHHWTEKILKEGSKREAKDDRGYRMHFWKPISLDERNMCLVEATSLDPNLMWELVRNDELGAKLPKCVCVPTSTSSAHAGNLSLWR